MPQNLNGGAVGATASILSPGASAAASPTYQTFTAHLAAHHQHPAAHMQHSHHQHQMFALAHAPLHQHGSGAAGAVQPSSPHQLAFHHHHHHHPAAAAGSVVHTAPYFTQHPGYAAAAASLYGNYDPNSAAAAAAAQQHQALTHHHHQQALTHHHHQQQQAALVAAHRTQLLDDQASLEDVAVGAAEHHQHLVHHQQPHQSQHYHTVAVTAHYPGSLYGNNGIGSVAVAAPSINTSSHQSTAYLPLHNPNQESYSVSHTPVVDHTNSNSAAAATVSSNLLSSGNDGSSSAVPPAATLRTASRNRPHFNFNGVSAERRRKRLHQHVAFHFSIRPEWNKVLGHSRASETKENELLREAGKPIIPPVPSDHVHIKHYISFFVEMRVGEVTETELMDAVEETPSLKVNRKLGTFWRSPPINFRLVSIPTDSLRNEQSQQVIGYEFRAKHTKDTLEIFLKNDMQELLNDKDFPTPQLIQADYQSAIIVFDDAESCKKVLQACRIQFHGKVLCAGYNVEGGCSETVCEGFKLDAKSMNSNYNEPAVEVPDASETDAEVLQQQQLELAAQLSPAVAPNNNTAASPSQVQVQQLIDSQESPPTGPTPLMSTDPQPSIAVETRPVSVAQGPPAVQMQSYVTGVPMYQNVLGAPSVAADSYGHQQGFYCANLYTNPGHVQHVFHQQPHQNHQQHSPAGLPQNSPHGAAQLLEGSGLQYSGYKTRSNNSSGMPNQGRAGLPMGSLPHGPQGVPSGQLVINKNRQQPIAPRFQNKHNTNADQLLDGNPPHHYMVQLAAASHHSSDATNGSRGKSSLGNVPQSGVAIQPQSIVNNNGNSPGSRERRDRRVGDYYQEVDGMGGHSGRVTNGRGVSSSSSALRGGRGGRGRGSGGRGLGNGMSSGGPVTSAFEDNDGDLIMPGAFSGHHNRHHQEFRATESDFPDLSPAGSNGTVEAQQPCPAPVQSAPQRRSARPVPVNVSTTTTVPSNSEAVSAISSLDLIPQASVSSNPAAVQPQIPSVAAVVAAAAAVTCKPAAAVVTIPPVSSQPVPTALIVCSKVDDSVSMLAAAAAANMSYAAALKKTQTLPDSDSEADPPLASPILLEEDNSVAVSQICITPSIPTAQQSSVPVALTSRGTTSAAAVDNSVQTQHTSQQHQSQYQSYSINGRYDGEDDYVEDYDKQSQHHGASYEQRNTFVRGGGGRVVSSRGVGTAYRGGRGAQVSRGNGAARGRGVEQGTARGNNGTGRGGVRGRGGGAASSGGGGSNFRRNQYE